MKNIRFTLISLAAVFGALVASAQQAQVISVTGASTVLVPGATAAVPLVIGTALPEGAVVTTGAGASVLIESHSGVQTGVGSETTVAVGPHGVSADGIRTAVIDVKSGTTVSVLDPSKRAVNNYAIRTPKGVAAARGTTYSTTVKLASGGEAIVTVNTTTGAVSFTIAATSTSPAKTVQVAAGRFAASNRGISTTIAAAIADASSPAEAADITNALKATVAVVSVIAQAASRQTFNGMNSQLMINEVVGTVTETANLLALDTNTAAAGTELITSTVTTVRQLADSASANNALVVMNRTSSAALRSTFLAAAVAPVTPVTVTVIQPTTTTPTTTTTITVAPTAVPGATQAQPDITIVVSPGS